MEEKNQAANGGVKEPTRSIYPTIDVPQSIQFVTQIYLDLGYSHFHDKEAIAQIFKTAYHNIKQKLSTAQQYGLLELKYGTGYKVTPLFLKLYRPEHEYEKRTAILEALKNPPLYEKLISEYNGHNMPSVVGLSTTLFRRHGLHEKAAQKAAQVFISNLTEQGLIGSDNVLCFDEGMMEIDEPKEVAEPIISNSPLRALPASTTAEIIPSDYLEIPIPLKNGKAFLRVPENATEEDFLKIARVVEAYK
jgi:hypothetical protein